MPDPTRKRFSYGQMQPESGRIVYVWSDFPHQIQFRFFPKKAWIISCKTDPDPIWMAWSEFGQTHLGRKQAGVQKLIRLVCGKVQQARYQFAIFRISSVLPQTSRIISCKTSPDPILIRLTVSGFGQTDPVRVQAGVRESSGLLLANASGPIRI